MTCSLMAGSAANRLLTMPRCRFPTARPFTLVGRLPSSLRSHLSNGTLQIDSNSNLGDAVNITTFAGTTFNVNGFTENIDQITGSGNIALGSGSLTFGDSSDFTFSGSISGSG